MRWIMGNTEAYENQKGTDRLTSKPQYQDYKSNLKVNRSEEEYLPMSWSMRRALVDGRKFQHVVPRKNTTVDVKTNMEKGAVNGKLSNTSIMKRTSSGSLMSERSDVEKTKPFKLKDEKTISENKDEGQIKEEVQELGNDRRKVSDTDLTLKKSIFTLQMEERMRKSRLELLGLQSQEWVEFSYKDKTCSNLNLPELKASDTTVKVDKYLEDCIQNCKCQEPKSDLKPAVLKDERILEYDVKHILKDDCNCDMCTLAYLTDMCPPKLASLENMKNGKNCHNQQEVLITKDNTVCCSPVKGRATIQPKKDKHCFSSLESFGSSFNEDSTNRRIRAEFCKNRSSNCPGSPKKDQIKRINGLIKTEVSVLESPRFENNLQNRNSTQDRKVLSKNEFYTERHEEFGVMKNNPVKKLELENNEGGEGPLTLPLEDITFIDGRIDLSKERGPIKNKLSKPQDDLRSRKSSFTQFETTPSSSLATLMSYRQVQQIFQSIVDMNHPKRRATRNITEFKNMEKLGLGEVRNRRWYPGADKTLSIWSGLHDSVLGIQAQFCKYHKPISNK